MELDTASHEADQTRNDTSNHPHYLPVDIYHGGGRMAGAAAGAAG